MFHDWFYDKFNYRVTVKICSIFFDIFEEFEEFRITIFILYKLSRQFATFERFQEVRIVSKGRF